MKTHLFCARFLAAFLILSFTLPTPCALAFRSEGAAESPRLVSLLRAGLEEKPFDPRVIKIYQEISRKNPSQWPVLLVGGFLQLYSKEQRVQFLNNLIWFFDEGPISQFVANVFLQDNLLAVAIRSQLLQAAAEDPSGQGFLALGVLLATRPEEELSEIRRRSSLKIRAAISIAGRDPVSLTPVRLSDAQSDADRGVPISLPVDSYNRYAHSHVLPLVSFASPFPPARVSMRNNLHEFLEAKFRGDQAKRRPMLMASIYERMMHLHQERAAHYRIMDIPAGGFLIEMEERFSELDHLKDVELRYRWEMGSEVVSSLLGEISDSRRNMEGYAI